MGIGLKKTGLAHLRETIRPLSERLRSLNQAVNWSNRGGVNITDEQVAEEVQEIWHMIPGLLPHTPTEALTRGYPEMRG